MYEIIQAPMAGGNATPALVDVDSQAGGLGFFIRMLRKGLWRKGGNFFF